MILASSNRVGWSLFQKELTNSCLGAKPISLAKVSFNNGGGGGQLAGGGQNGHGFQNRTGPDREVGP